MNNGTALFTGALGLVALSAMPATAHDIDYADLAERVSPAVVNVFTKRDAKPSAETPGGLEDEQMRRFLERFGMPGTPRGRGGRDSGPSEALGSGFILDAEGYVITNNHVVEGSDSVRLRLSDDREFDAVIVGTDERTDVALLKIESPEDLPDVDFGNSDAVRVGEAVMAVGNPFGLGGTVTTGIVSAKGRDINTGGPYVDYLQTDASINRGNSGGPLFNMKGEVIGVNTAIYSPTGGSVGVGFAVPSNVVERIVAELKEDGSVDRGWLGVRIQPVTDTIAEALGLSQTDGALVSGVEENGPSAGTLRSGDVILAFDGKDVKRSRDLPRIVGMTDPETAVPVRILRDGEEETLTVTLGLLGEDGPKAIPASLGKGKAAGRLGVTLSEGTDGGAVITEVDPDSAAAKAGLREGDVILGIGDTDVDGPKAVSDALKATERSAVLLKVRRGDASIFVGVDLDKTAG